MSEHVTNDEKKPFEDAIRIVDAIEAIRLRPGMYVGDVREAWALQAMVEEAIGAAFGRHDAREARNVRIDVDDEGYVTVEDDGLGLPVLRLERDGRSAAELLFTEVNQRTLIDSFGMACIGLVAVNALSSVLEVETRTDGKSWRARFERGQRIQPFTVHGSAATSGTRIRFLPDATIFDSITIDRPTLEARLRDLAWLHPLLAVRWQGQALPGRGGLVNWLPSLAGEALPREQCFATRRVIDDCTVDLAFGWREPSRRLVRGFVNAMPIGQGTHIVGLLDGLASAARDAGCTADHRVARELVSKGLVAVVHVDLEAPRFAGGTRERLTTPATRTAVARTIVEGLRTALTRQDALAQRFRAVITP